jgi:hypothetical protein
VGWSCNSTTGGTNATCTANRNPYACTGSITPNSLVCTNDDTGLTADTPWTLKSSCTLAAKCERVCDSGRVFNATAGTCDCAVTSVPGICDCVSKLKPVTNTAADCTVTVTHEPCSCSVQWEEWGG